MPENEGAITPPRPGAEVTFDFVCGGTQTSVVSGILPCCGDPSPVVGERHERPADDPPESDDKRWPDDGEKVVGGLLTKRGGRSWWLGCSNCGSDIVGIVWDPGAEDE